MAKLVTNNKKVDSTNLLLLIGMISVTIIFIVLSIIIIVKPGQVKNLDDINEVTLANYKRQGSEENPEYLILVYSSERNENYDYSIHRNELIENIVVEYANFAKDNKDQFKIYVLDVSKEPKAIDTFNLTDETYVPALILMKNGSNGASVNRTYKNVTDIVEYLEGKMK